MAGSVELNATLSVIVGLYYNDGCVENIQGIWILKETNQHELNNHLGKIKNTLQDSILPLFNRTNGR
jgi:hypothetical protein